MKNFLDALVICTALTTFACADIAFEDDVAVRDASRTDSAQRTDARALDVDASPSTDAAIDDDAAVTDALVADDGGGDASLARDGGSIGVERCGNGLDDDGDRAIDEGCLCSPGSTQPCFVGDPAQIGRGICRAGSMTCVSMGEFGAWGACTGSVVARAEICDNRLDDDCDGTVDEGCPTICNVTVNLNGDCLTARCPAACPYPVGCDITMSGGDDRGCVASQPGSPEVYFQEGDACGAGRVTGTLRCSSVRGAGLNAGNCRINKPQRYYPTSRSGCPDT